MKILEVCSLAIPEIKVIRFGRFPDSRGYFAESFRESDIQNTQATSFLREVVFSQVNESYSRPNVIRGLHFQWNPRMGKLVRTVTGHMVDLVLDIRQGSPHYGQILAYDMPSPPEAATGEWIWVPPGFAHGNFFLEPTWIEYFCSGEYNPDAEAGIYPLSPDLDWSLCDPAMKTLFDQVASKAILSEKDRGGLSLAAWSADPRRGEFVYGMC